eukprot:2882469-Pleurochrysis_carterae.AAC.6
MVSPAVSLVKPFLLPGCGAPCAIRASARGHGPAAPCECAESTLSERRHRPSSGAAAAGVSSPVAQGFDGLGS